MIIENVHVKIDEDEWYPVFSLTKIAQGEETNRRVVQVPIALFKKSQRLMKAFAKLQAELGAL